MRESRKFHDQAAQQIQQVSEAVRADCARGMEAERAKLAEERVALHKGMRREHLQVQAALVALKSTWAQVRTLEGPALAAHAAACYFL